MDVRRGLYRLLAESSGERVRHSRARSHGHEHEDEHEEEHDEEHEGEEDHDEHGEQDGVRIVMEAGQGRYRDGAASQAAGSKSCTGA